MTEQEIAQLKNQVKTLQEQNKRLEKIASCAIKLTHLALDRADKRRK